MKKTLISTSILLAAAVVGCSVKQGSVPNVPPTISAPKELGFTVTYGNLRPQLFSVLMWPTEWTEQQTERNVDIINTTSKDINHLFVQVSTDQATIIQLWTDFQSQNCIANFRRPLPAPADGSPAPTQPDPADVDETSTVDLAAPTDSSLMAAYNACVENQNRRQAAHADISDIQQNRIPTDSQTIDNAIGKENELFIDPTSSRITIQQDAQGAMQVAMTLVNFNQPDSNQPTRKQQTPKTADDAKDPSRLKSASIDVAGRHLQFTVPDMSSTQNADGSYSVAYRFDLYRTENLISGAHEKIGDSLRPADFVVFKGDVAKLVNGQAVRAGSAQIVGELIGPAPKP